MNKNIFDIFLIQYNNINTSHKFIKTNNYNINQLNGNIKRRSGKNI